MTREEFIDFYCKATCIPWERLSKRNVVLPCFCGDDCCKGWAVVTNTPEAIKAHEEIYSKPEIEI